MAEVHTTITTDKRAELLSILRRLPAILTGRVPDVNGIAEGFRTRIGFGILSLVAPNFEELSRGRTGADGTKWPPLSKEYLAYQRRFGPGEQSTLKKAAGLGRTHHYAPGDKKGLLTKEQLRMWRRVYADRLQFYIMRMADDEAKAKAAAIAWIEVKKAGAKTMLEVYGNRQVQILVDQGLLRGSLQPGTLVEQGAKADYQEPSGNGGDDQIFEVEDVTKVVVGSRDKKAAWHHNAKNPRRRRRLWPESFPADWWRQILGIAVSGLQKIGEQFRQGG